MEKQAGAAGAAEAAGPNRKPWGLPSSGPNTGETPESPTGSHVEWCKQLIAATISSQISGSVPSDINRDNKARRRPDFMMNDRKPDGPSHLPISCQSFHGKRSLQQDSQDEELCYHGESDSDSPNLPALRYGAQVTMSQNQVPLLPGETVQTTVKDVMYICPFSGLVNGTLTITDYKLYFTSVERESPFILDVNLGVISRLETISVPNQGENTKGLELVCKDMRSPRFAYKTEESNPDVVELLAKHAFPLSHSLPLFAFLYKEQFPVDGWKVYDPTAEYRRQGLPNESWTFSKMNSSYELCDTYPFILVIPTNIAEDDIKRVAVFRAKHRIPVLSWIHPESQATIIRCSQPLVGPSDRRCKEDEHYLQIIMDANAQSHKLTIFDARQSSVAVTNKAKDGGFESESFYPNVELNFLEIPNIHVMRESLRKMKDVVYPTIDEAHWHSAIDQTHWLEYIRYSSVSRCSILSDKCHIEGMFWIKLFCPVQEVQTQTVSLWSYINSQFEDFTNPFYVDYEHHVLYPLVSSRHLELWTAYYARWNPRMRPQVPVHQTLKELLLLRGELQRRVDELQRDATSHSLTSSSEHSPAHSTPLHSAV
ncbi:myotubularin-related protein 1-like [Notothenia coriiceps]|uniref:phosphatidylinositol-3,5-bisphosphate 3-phosphatase n=1 Tax=Notothenia coriiceps TaxID=8208 RepID=A0A6I9Q4E9_9TELE|nr:PREDICTED: myotubularin-related protein 1-like [Notothenia coriiceps]